MNGFQNTIEFFAMIILLALSLTVLPAILMAMSRKEQYRFRVSTYFFLLFAVRPWSILIAAVLSRTEIFGRIPTPAWIHGDIVALELIFVSFVSLMATSTWRKELKELLLLFLFPIVLFSLLKVYLAHQGFLPREPMEIRNQGIIQITMLLANHLWGWLCFCHYCIFRLRRLCPSPAGAEPEIRSVSLTP